MKAFLLYKDQDFDLQSKSPTNEQSLIQDLELNTLFNAMALKDTFIFEVSKKVILSSLKDINTIRYRQSILKDCLKNPTIIRDLYAIVTESIENEKKNYLSLFSRYPAGILHRSIDVLEMFVVMLKKLRNIADQYVDQFESEGFRTFFEMIQRELEDDYFDNVENQLKELKFPNGVLISAELGKGNEGTSYVLRKLQSNGQSWIRRLINRKISPYTFCIHERDESGSRALSELKDRGVNLVANALAQSVDHILSFFQMLHIELGFYIGCLNLYEQLREKGEPVTFPEPMASQPLNHSFNGLYDICLSLIIAQRVIGNALNADSKDLVIITGANQGGKSTFLRSIGLSQLMMQCGMFVPAEHYCASICDGLFTHYKREEDAAMNSGKLDEELSRMSDIVDHITSNAIILLNESFAATNEREGSEIARQIISALLDKGIRVFCVTHLYELSHGFFSLNLENAIFLRAEREYDGSRTFKVIKGEPLKTSYGEDLYHKILNKGGSGSIRASRGKVYSI